MQYKTVFTVSTMAVRVSLFLNVFSFFWYTDDGFGVCIDAIAFSLKDFGYELFHIREIKVECLLWHIMLIYIKLIMKEIF